MFQFLPFFNKYVKFSGLYSSQDSNQTRTVIQTIRYLQAFFVCIQNKQAWKSFSDYDLAIKNFTKKFLLRSRLQKYGFWKTGFWPEKADPDVRETLGTWGIIMCLDFEQMYIKMLETAKIGTKLETGWNLSGNFFFLQKLDILIISLMTYLNLQYTQPMYIANFDICSHQIMEKKMNKKATVKISQK